MYVVNSNYSGQSANSVRIWEPRNTYLLVDVRFGRLHDFDKRGGLVLFRPGTHDAHHSLFNRGVALPNLPHRDGDKLGFEVGFPRHVLKLLRERRAEKKRLPFLSSR